MLRSCPVLALILSFTGLVLAELPVPDLKITAQVQPESRYAHLTYSLPAGIPDAVTVRCTYSTDNGTTWRPAAVRKLRSATADFILYMQGDRVMETEQKTGQVTEYLGAGQKRTLVWATFPQLAADKVQAVAVTIDILDTKGQRLAVGHETLTVDLRDVVIFKDASRIFQKDLLRPAGSSTPGWTWTKGDAKAPYGMLEAIEGPTGIEPITYRPSLKGYYAIYVSVPYDPPSKIELRLGDDFYSRRFSGLDSREYFWRIAKMDQQELVISQPYSTIQKGSTPNDAYRARLRYVRFVPISDALYATLIRPERFSRDKLVFAYFEPYSWAFDEIITSNAKLSEPMAAYAEARVDRVDIQLNRLGARPVHPSAVEEPIRDIVFGDSTPDTASPPSPDVARLALLSSAWRGFHRFGGAFGLPVNANFGAGVSYHGSVMEGTFSIKHPEWFNGGNWPQYKFPPVRQYFLAQIREVLEQGARGVSIDFRRYEFVVDDAAQATLFLTELRQLADQFTRGSDRVKIQVRFPVPGVRAERGCFRPREWIQKGLVDFLVPSGHSGNTQNFDARPYIEMTRGTGVKCLPCLDGLSWGLAWPEPTVARVKQFYDWGADGVYIYQADAHIVGTMTYGLQPEHLPLIANFGSTKAVAAMLEDLRRQDRAAGPDIYLYFSDADRYTSCRARAWIDGPDPERVELYHDGKLMNTYTRPPYTLGKEGYQNNYPALDKPSTVKVRARINGKWLERSFTIKNIVNDSGN